MDRASSSDALSSGLNPRSVWKYHWFTPKPKGSPRSQAHPRISELSVRGRVKQKKRIEIEYLAILRLRFEFYQAWCLKNWNYETEVVKGQSLIDWRKSTVLGLVESSPNRIKHMTRKLLSVTPMISKKPAGLGIRQKSALHCVYSTCQDKATSRFISIKTILYVTEKQMVLLSCMMSIEY